MRIAYVCADSGVPVFGSKGCSIHVQEVVRALRRLGARVELFAARAGGSPPPDLAGVRLHALPAPAARETAARETEAYAANRNLREALRRAGRFDLVYERYSLWSFAAMEHAREAGAAGLLEVNAPLVEEQAAHRALADRARAEHVARRVFTAASRLVAVSEGVADYLRRFEAARGRVHVVPNGVDPSRFPRGLRPTIMRGPGTFTVGFVGTLKPWHGLPTLLEAFARLHARHARARLLVVGDGPEREAIVESLGAATPPDAGSPPGSSSLCGAARLTGAVSPVEIPGLLASMDAGVAPYPAAANFYFSPLKVYEYMAAGLPVVASRVGQLGELISHEVNGLLVRPGDAGELAAALERLRGDVDLRARLGGAARALVLEKHTWDAVARRILSLAAPGDETRVGGGRGEREGAELSSRRKKSEEVFV